MLEPIVFVNRGSTVYLFKYNIIVFIILTAISAIQIIVSFVKLQILKKCELEIRNDIGKRIGHWHIKAFNYDRKPTIKHFYLGNSSRATSMILDRYEERRTPNDQFMKTRRERLRDFRKLSTFQRVYFHKLTPKLLIIMNNTFDIFT